tara:strand:+ start:2234 stop:4036 length:1803 start_codon:yes stop_codon:yes gene_type:complete
MESMLAKKHSYKMSKELRTELEQAVIGLEIMPSMRAVMTAGPALDRCNVGAYNCSYLPIDNPRAFDEAMYILMNGTGVGFSVERDHVEKLPVVNETFHRSNTTIVVDDSRIGWVKSLREMIACLYAGQIPKWDVSRVRPAGARLKTFGGRASGPKPLEDLFHFCIAKFTGAVGRKLYPIECHDIMCKIGDVVVVGGVRRSALISLSNLGDDQMRHAKSGEWWKFEGQRSLANNSVSYRDTPEMGTFMREWLSLYESKSGERGIFNRAAANTQVAKTKRREEGHVWGTNPCSEIILRPYQFCNLSEVVVRPTDTAQSLNLKVKQATILGTFQSCLTNFKYLRAIWKRNTEEERLLGVSLTGIMDNPLLFAKEGLVGVLEDLKKQAVYTNKTLAKQLGIPVSAAITCVKPSGTVSQLVDSASGIHSRHSPYYIRTVRADNKDPMTQFMIDSGVPAEPDAGKPESTTVFSFPFASPEDAISRTDRTAIEQLELWLIYQRHWCEHKPSITVTVRENEWLEVGAWVYKHFDEISGISFLPFDDHIYHQAPYQDCDKEEYIKLKKVMPNTIDWERLAEYEKEDTTTGAQDLACSAGICEVVDIQAA